MIQLENFSDLKGLLKVDPNSYFPFKKYFSKVLQQDLYFFCRLNTTVQIFSDEFERLRYDAGYNNYENKYGYLGVVIRTTMENVEYIPSQQEIRDLIRFIFKNQLFTEQEHAVLSNSKSTNKLLIDIRRTGGDHPYHYILDYAYHVNPEHTGFKNLVEKRLLKEVSIRSVLEELNQKIIDWKLNPEREWENVFRAMVAMPRGEYEYNPTI